MSVAPTGSGPISSDPKKFPDKEKITLSDGVNPLELVSNGLFEGVLPSNTQIIKEGFGSEKTSAAAIESGVISKGDNRPEYLKCKDGALWRCVGRERPADFIKLNSMSEDDGYIYRFVYKKEVQVTDEFEFNLFPALEPYLENINQIVGGEKSLLNLGFFVDVEKNEIYLPDQAIIIQRLMKTLNRNEDDIIKNVFPFVSADGIASHLDFAEAFIDGKIVISKNKEFVHDQVVHVIPFLLRYFDNALLKGSKENRGSNLEVKTKYDLALEEIQGNIKRLINCIKLVESKMENKEANSQELTPRDLFILKMALGMYVDNVASSGSIDEYIDIGLKKYLPVEISVLADNESIFHYFNRQLKENNFVEFSATPGIEGPTQVQIAEKLLKLEEKVKQILKSKKIGKET